MIFVGFYTLGTPYEQEVVECIKSLDAFGLDHDFIGVPSLGNWCLNCSQKPQAIRQLQSKHDGRPIVYIDVDARVRKFPDWLICAATTDLDIAVHYRNGYELLSGTIYLGATQGAREIVQRWCEACRSEPGVWDQKHLQAILDVPHSYVVDELPADYVAIFDGGMSDDPVIEHFQASRKHRVWSPS